MNNRDLSDGPFSVKAQALAVTPPYHNTNHSLVEPLNAPLPHFSLSENNQKTVFQFWKVDPMVLKELCDMRFKEFICSRDI